MSPTIKDIAKELGISNSSVSRALNGKKGVSEKTRKNIQRLANELEYEPNDLARGLVNKVSKTIGIIIPEITNPFFSEIVKGIIEESTKENYDIFLCVSNWDADIEASYLKALKKKQVDGLIIKPARDQDVSIYEKIKMPYVILESWETLNNTCSISLDNEKGGYLATKHLLKCGYNNILFLAGKEESISSKQRKIGWKKALREAGLKGSESNILYTSFSIESGYEATKKFIEAKGTVDGIFAVNDVVALGALQYLSEKNIPVPEKIGVIGFDNISYSRLPQIMLTTINQPVYEMGTTAFKAVVDMLKGKDDVKGKSIVFEPELIVRRTTRGVIDGKN